MALTIWKPVDNLCVENKSSQAHHVTLLARKIGRWLATVCPAEWIRRLTVQRAREEVLAFFGLRALAHASLPIGSPIGSSTRFVFRSARARAGFGKAGDAGPGV